MERKWRKKQDVEVMINPLSTVCCCCMMMLVIKCYAVIAVHVAVVHREYSDTCRQYSESSSFCRRLAATRCSLAGGLSPLKSVPVSAAHVFSSPLSPCLHGVPRKASLSSARTWHVDTWHEAPLSLQSLQSHLAPSSSLSLSASLFSSSSSDGV